jgi:hypothetical protein
VEKFLCFQFTPSKSNNTDVAPNDDVIQLKVFLDPLQGGLLKRGNVDPNSFLLAPKVCFDG